MTILGFADRGIVKSILKDANIVPASVRKVIVGDGYLDVFFHNGDKMVRVDAPKSLIKIKKK